MKIIVIHTNGEVTEDTFKPIQLADAQDLWDANYKNSEDVLAMHLLRPASHGAWELARSLVKS